MDWVLFAALAVLALAGFVHGLFGIGFAMIATPLLALLLGYRAAVWMAAVPLLLMACSWLLLHHRQLRMDRLPPSLFMAIAIGAVIGTTFQTKLPERAALLLLALLLGVNMLVSILRDSGRLDRRVLPVHAMAGGFGLCAGITEAALNVGAPFMLLYGSLASLNRIGQLVALNVCFALGKAIQVGITTASGAPEVGTTALIGGTAASMVAFYAGNSVATRFSEFAFQKFFRAFLAVLIVALVARAAFF